MNEATMRNLSIDELLGMDEPCCATEIYRRLRDEADVIIDVGDHYTEQQYTEACESEQSYGRTEGLEEGKEEGRIEGYEDGYKDCKDGKEFDENYS